MIAVLLEGGLGNQLFQYATARAIAMRHATHVMVDKSFLDLKKKSTTSRPYELDVFNCPTLAIANNFYSSILARRCGWIFSMISSWTALIENGEHFNESALKAPDNSYLVGYWQSYKYFDHIKEVLLHDFSPKIPLSPQSLQIKEVIHQCQVAIAVHIRRGDYITSPQAKRFHGNLPLDYYHKSIRLMMERFHGVKFFIFSDDIDWCKKNLGIGFSAEYIDHNGASDAWQDLVLMSACDHHIIANSSFSWWGAWLAGIPRNPSEHFVIYPKNWFNQKPINPADRFPSAWVGL
jgi:Glycosyl transferase family 11